MIAGAAARDGGPALPAPAIGDAGGVP
jgi:hypothetical protein